MRTTPREMELSPGAVAEYLGVPIERARAAIRAAGLLDERGRPKRWFSPADCDGPLHAALQEPTPPATMEADPSPQGGDEPGEPETVSAEDLAEVEQLTPAPRRRKR